MIPEVWNWPLLALIHAMLMVGAIGLMMLTRLLASVVSAGLEWRRQRKGGG